MVVTELILTQPDDWHLHLRDLAMLRAVLPDTAKQFARAIVMPNLKPPVTHAKQALAYKQRIIAALPEGIEFEPLMSLYLTDHTSADEIEQAFHARAAYAVKLYPAGATTNSDAGVTDLNRCTAVLEKMQAIGMPLLVHGEVTQLEVDIFDREARFIEDVLQPLRKSFPELKIVFEHITTKHAVEYILDTAQPNLAATITAHHLLYNRNAMFSGGLRPHYYCLPVLKREEHRQALLKAATSGLPYFFLGTDSAPHLQGDKESACGCAGCYTALHAMPLYAQAFAQANALERLEGFASFFGADFYGLPRNTRKIRLIRQAWKVPAYLPLEQGRLIPLAAQQTLDWQLA